MSYEEYKVLADSNNTKKRFPAFYMQPHVGASYY